MAASTSDRLEQIYPVITTPEFRRGRGLGNEVAFYIFDYDPKDEPLVQEYVPRLKTRLAVPGIDMPVLEIDLYLLMIDILEEKGYLDKLIKREAQRGSEALFAAARPILRPDTLVEAIERRLREPHAVVFITGVGASWPLIRSHTVLNNLHAVIDETPLVMFFPGEYTGQELRLFNEFKDDNYYRAFPLIPRTAV